MTSRKAWNDSTVPVPRSSLQSLILSSFRFWRLLELPKADTSVTCVPRRLSVWRRSQAPKANKSVTCVLLRFSVWRNSRRFSATTIPLVTRKQPCKLMFVDSGNRLEITVTVELSTQQPKSRTLTRIGMSSRKVLSSPMRACNSLQERYDGMMRQDCVLSTKQVGKVRFPCQLSRISFVLPKRVKRLCIQ